MGAGGLRIAIIGGGFSGTVAAIKLLDAAGDTPLRLQIIEPRAELGRGLAFSSDDPAHLLNGPAKLFSLHPDHPDHFIEWTRDRAASDAEALPDAFARRSAYGDYVRAELDRALAANRGRSRLEHIRTTAVAVAERAGPDAGVTVTLADGPPLEADLLILALGVFPHRPPFAIPAEAQAHGRYLADPWALASAEVPPEGTIAYIGGGLTMLDGLVTLERRGFRGRHVSVSRHGLVVQPRREPPPLGDFLAEGPWPTTALALLRRVRPQLDAIAAAGGDWQAVVPAIRPHVAALWARASNVERARFLRHLRRYWDIALHRGPGPSIARLEQVRAEGRFASHAARITGLTDTADGRIALALRRRNGTRETLIADRVVNCTGSEFSWPRLTHHALIGQLLASGLVRPGPLGLGIAADGTGAAISAAGSSSDRIFGIGPILRGSRWESSTIAEIIGQATAIGALVASRSSALLRSHAA